VIIFGEYFLPSASQKHLLKVESATAKIIQIKYFNFCNTNLMRLFIEPSGKYSTGLRALGVSFESFAFPKTAQKSNAKETPGTLRLTRFIHP
jgi:hypothetical protein